MTQQQLGYAPRIIRAQSTINNLLGRRCTFTEVWVEHDDDCPVVDGGVDCTCLPDIRLETEAGDFTVDEEGIPHPVSLEIDHGIKGAHDDDIIKQKDLRQALDDLGCFYVGPCDPAAVFDFPELADRDKPRIFYTCFCSVGSEPNGIIGHGMKIGVAHIPWHIEVIMSDSKGSALYATEANIVIVFDRSDPLRMKPDTRAASHSLPLHLLRNPVDALEAAMALYENVQPHFASWFQSE